MTGRTTELPFYSIAAEMWRGIRDCSEALAAIDKANPNAQAAAMARAMDAEVAPLLAQIRKSMAADAGTGYGTFRLNFHRFDRFELDLRWHTQP